MRSTSAHRLAIILAVLGVGLFATAARADVTVRSLNQDLPVGDARSVGFHAPVGELQVVPADGDSIRAEVALRCERDGDSRCEKAARDVDLRIRTQGDRILVDVDDWPKLGSHGLSVRARLEVPRGRSIEVDMGVGEVSIDGVDSDVEVDVGVGEISVTMPEAAVRSVDLDSGVGEVTLRVGGRTIDGTGFVGGSLEWKDGPGRASIELDSGVGEIHVTLE